MRRWKRRGALWALTVSLLGAAWACGQEAGVASRPEPGDNTSNTTPNNTPADAGADVDDAPEDVRDDDTGVGVSEDAGVAMDGGPTDTGDAAPPVGGGSKGGCSVAMRSRPVSLWGWLGVGR